MAPSLARPRRLGSTFVLLLHVAALVAWRPLELAGTGNGTPHVEVTTTADCPAAHDEARCQTCQAASSRLLVAESGAAVTADGAEFRAPTESPTAASSHPALPRSRSRAPPSGSS